jgi:hypothetical protein
MTMNTTTRRATGTTRAAVGLCGEQMRVGAASAYQSRDAEVLAAGTFAARGVVSVQCTQRTRDTLRRAGLSRCVMFARYEVRVVRDRFNRLQLAPTKGGSES